MTKEQFKSKFNISGGQFVFNTDKHEGMIGISPLKVFIWVDVRGWANKPNVNDDLEPSNIGEFETVDELLSSFKVGEKLFSEFVLPNINKLNQIYT